VCVDCVLSFCALPDEISAVNGYLSTIKIEISVMILPRGVAPKQFPVWGDFGEVFLLIVGCIFMHF